MLANLLVPLPPQLKAKEPSTALELTNLTSANRRSKNIVVKAIIVPELELRNVKMQVLFADIVECADDAAFDDAPETFNRIRVNGTNNVLPLRMIDSDVRIGLSEAVVTNPLIGAEQANLVRNGFVDESLQRRSADVFNDAGHDIALAADSTGNDCLARSGRTGNAITAIPMPVLGPAADECFVHFDNATQLGFRFDQGGSDFVRHQPRRLDRTETHIAAKLASAHALFASQDQMRDFEPVAERLVRILEDSPGEMRKPIAVHGALLALPVMAGSERIALIVTAARANDTVRPAPRDQIGNAGIFIANGEHGIKLSRSELVNGPGALGFGHGVSSFVGGYCHG
jgi:hypothetical protein